MKNHLRAAIALLLVPGFALATQTLTLPTFAQAPSHCLLFTVDGLDRDYITSDIAPNLTAWKHAGAYLPDAINVFPTATTPNMSSLYTGAYPITTGVGGNLVFRKNQKRFQTGPRPRKIATLNDAFTSAGKSTGAVQIYMMEEAGYYSRVPEAVPEDVTTMALSMLTDATSVPVLTAVLFETVDKIGHKYGPDSPEVRGEVGRVDAAIGAIVRRYADLGLLSKTMVLITADHGMSAADNEINQAKLSEVVASQGLKFDWINRTNQQVRPDADLYLLQAGNIQGYFNRPFSLEEQKRLFTSLSAIEGIGLIHDTTTLQRMHCDPSGGDFVAEPAPGWRFRGNRGVHGTNRESDGYQTFFGAGVKPGVTVRNAHTVDIMPTILKAFGIAIPDSVDGHPLTEGLIPGK